MSEYGAASKCADVFRRANGDCVLKMAQRTHIDDVMRGRIIGRLEAGQTQQVVARALRVPQSVISRLWQRFQQTGNVSRRYSTGRPQCTTPQEDRYLTISARRRPRSTAGSLTRDLATANGTVVSRHTVYRRLNRHGLFARRPARCVSLTPVHRRARKAWCQEHSTWSLEQWSQVMFTGESRYSLNSDSRRVIIWREPGTRYQPRNVLERDLYGGGGLMVWGGIMIGSRTPLHVFDRGTVTGQVYRDVILHQYVRLFRGAVGPTFLLMDDNARPH